MHTEYQLLKTGKMRAKMYNNVKEMGMNFSKVSKVLLVFTFLLIITVCSNNYGNEIIYNSLFIPPVLQPESVSGNLHRYIIKINQGYTVFAKNKKVETYGYNGNLLGPTLRFKKGDDVEIRVYNNLKESTTVHWHGMLVPGEADGGPHQKIESGNTWTAKFKVVQNAASLWYHPHGIRTTGKQVYKGLAGMIIIDDGLSRNLNLPDRYGENDIPLIVQDRRINNKGELIYIDRMSDIAEGMKGDTIIVNGTINPVLDVSNRKYRFRILNGSNARMYNFSFSDGRDFHLIATDGGFIERPVKLKQLPLSPGERAEIIIDLADMKRDESISLVSGLYEILKIRKSLPDTKDTTVLPGKLSKIEFIAESSAGKKRNFILQGMGHMVSINRKQMNMNRIDEKVKINTTEIWNVSNIAMGMMMGGNIIHNFHIHAVQFLILDRNGREPFDFEKGWKDTVNLYTGDRVRLIMRFYYKGVFMYHCHILEHEDNGMMGQFLVE